MMWLTVAALTVVLTASGQLLLKFGANKRPGSLMNGYVLAGYGLFVATVGLAFLLLHHIPLKSFTMIMSANYIAVAVFARVFLGETFSTRKVIGTAMITAGVVWFSAG